MGADGVGLGDDAVEELAGGLDGLSFGGGLATALGGFGLGYAGDIPAWQAVEVTQGDVLMCTEMYFEQHHEACQRRHHAAVDAEALRWGYEAVIKGARS